MAGEQALGGGGSREGGPDLKRACEVLEAVGFDYSNAGGAALELTYAYGAIIARVAHELVPQSRT